MKVKSLLLAFAAALVLACLTSIPSTAYAQTPLYPMCLASGTLPNGPLIICPSGLPVTMQGGTISGGTTFTLGTGTGACATSSTLLGGAVAGSFVCTGTAGASTQVVNLPTTANGWSCWVADVTSGVAGSTVAPVATTSAKLKIPIATTSDVVQFGCIGY